MKDHLRVWNDGNIRRVVIGKVISNILPESNVVIIQNLEIYDVPLCDSMSQPKVSF
jgi:hypothetical protein